MAREKIFLAKFGETHPTRKTPGFFARRSGDLVLGPGFLGHIRPTDLLYHLRELGFLRAIRRLGSRSASEKAGYGAALPRLGLSRDADSVYPLRHIINREHRLGLAQGRGDRVAPDP